MATQLGPVIARRELVRVGSRRPVVVEIGKPRRRPTGEWACPYRIGGLGRSGVKQAYGEDAVQALQLALDGVRAHLEPFPGSCRTRSDVRSGGAWSGS